MCKAKVKVDWEHRQMSFGKPRVTISWADEPHLGETQSENGYTSDFSDSTLIIKARGFNSLEAGYLDVF